MVTTFAPNPLKAMGWTHNGKPVNGDQCYQCFGSLAVSRGAVRCTRCGNVQSGHPMQLKIDEYAKVEAARPKATEPVQPMDPQYYAATHADRLLVAERKIKAQEEVVKGLAERLLRLEKAWRK
jgi:hypothetical protein